MIYKDHHSWYFLSQLLSGWASAFGLCTWIVIGSAFHPVKEELPSFNDTRFCYDQSPLAILNNNDSYYKNNITNFTQLKDISQFQTKYLEEMSILANRSISGDASNVEGTKVEISSDDICCVFRETYNQ